MNNYYITFKSVKVLNTDSNSEQGAWNRLSLILPDQYSRRVLEKQGYKAKKEKKNDQT